MAIPPAAVPVHHQPRPVRQPRGSVAMTTQRVALVTGAVGGQGWAIVKRLRGEGYAVAACDRRTEDLVAAVDQLGDNEVIGIPLDVTSPAQWAAAVDRVVDR